MSHNVTKKQWMHWGGNTIIKNNKITVLLELDFYGITAVRTLNLNMNLEFS